MTPVIKVKVKEMDGAFIDNLKREFGDSALEIRVIEQNESGPAFTEDDFWDLVALLDWSDEENDAKVVEPLVKALEQGPLANIYRFEDILSEKLWQLDTLKHAQVFFDDPEEEGFLSVDDFLYARCAVVANGKDYFIRVLNNPSEMPPELTFEPLLSIASVAYKNKTGKPFVALPVFPYETYSNKKGWVK